MNDRIKELAEQAHCYACKYAQQPDYNPHSPYNQAMYKQQYDEKFAELIVRECIQVAVNKDSGYMHTAQVAGYMAAGRSTAAQMIREHFGVEE